MALKESMDILIKDMKIQDARIEADRQTYADLLGNVEKHTKELKRRKEEKEIFEQLLYRIGGERDFFKDSVQIQTLEDLALAQEREIADNNHLIVAQQAYYDALRKKDYQTLWEQDEDKSAMAAICFAVEQWRDTSTALVQKLLGTRKHFSEDVARYLLEKILVYSESKREADETADRTDRFIRDILDRTLSDAIITFNPQSDAAWRNIEVCLNIRKTQRTGARCKKVLNRYQEHKSRFETFEEDYADNCREISAEIERLENQKVGGEVTSAVQSAKEWFTNRTAQLDSLIKRRRSEAALIEDHLQTLQSMYAELENGMESGLQPERCDAICNTLSAMESEAAGVVDTGELDRERKKLLEEYQAHLKEIRAAKDAEIEREKEDQRIKVKKKTERERRFRKALPFVVAGAIVIFLFVRYCGNVYYGTKVYFGKLFYRNYRVAEGVETIPDLLFRENKSIETITLPESFTSIGAFAFDGCSSLKEIVIPESVTSIGSSAFNGCSSLKEIVIPESIASIGSYTFSGCSSLKEIVIPESVTSIESDAFNGCSSLKEVVIPESVTSIGSGAFSGCSSLERVELRSNTLSMGGSVFYNCGSLKEIKSEGNIADFEHLLEGNVRNCCNLDMSELYDDLYCAAIEGVPLLENEVQLKNLLDQREIPYGEEVVDAFDPAFDILTDAEFGEETGENTRSVDFSFDVKHNGVIYTFEAYVTGSGSELDVRMECTNVDSSELLQKLRAGDRNAILEMLGGQKIPVNGVGMILNRDEITVMESELIEESGESYCIPLKLKINKPLGEITFLGRAWLLEQNDYLPKLIPSKTAADIDLLGSYTYSREDGTEVILTIDKQYERCYSVTEDGKKGILIMDMAAGGDGTFISGMGDEDDYTIYSAGLNTGMDGIWIRGTTYYKTGSAVSDTMPEDITPFAGVWQGTYQAGRGVTVNSRRYILPTEADYSAVAVISDFGPMEGKNDFSSGVTLDVLNYDPQSGSCVIESKNWLKQPDGYVFAMFEGNVNDSYDVISGGDGEKGSFTIAKTEPDNTTGMAVDTGDWSIYDASGNVKEKLLVFQNIPEDAFTWNDSSYYLYGDFKTWEEAEAYCESLGGHLAIITSAEENKAVYSYVREQGYRNAFFGASDTAKEGEWRWVDGSAMSYTNWHKNEPNNDKGNKASAEDYIMYYSKYDDGTWNDGAYIEFGPNVMMICEWD